MNEKQTTPFPLRLPEDLRTLLEVDARKAGRSLNAEIVMRLERDISEQRRPPPKYLKAQDVMPWLIAIADKLGLEPPVDIKNQAGTASNRDVATRTGREAMWAALKVPSQKTADGTYDPPPGYDANKKGK